MRILKPVLVIVLCIIGTGILSEDYIVLDEIAEVYGKQCTIKEFRHFAKTQNEHETIDFMEEKMNLMNSRQLLDYLRELGLYKKADLVIEMTTITETLSSINEQKAAVEHLKNLCGLN